MQKAFTSLLSEASLLVETVSILNNPCLQKQ